MHCYTTINVTVHLWTRYSAKQLLAFYVLIEFEVSSFVLKYNILCANKEIQTNID